MRKNTKIICKICGFETKVNGLANHVTNKHNISIESYIELYGEYRPKYIDYNERASKNNHICKICNQSFASERHLSFHLKKKHDITKQQYIIDYILNGEIPKCKCGCGQEVNIKTKGGPPYWFDYISGHNTCKTHVGLTRTFDSKMKMRKSAIARLQNGNSVFFKGKSIAEIDLLNFIKTIYNGKIIESDTDILSGLELDIFLPDLNIALELNGDRFHSDLFKKKNYHLKKTKECEQLGIKLIHIWLYEWYRHPDIIKSKLNHMIGNNSIKIWARNCEIKEVSNTDSSLFLNLNHLQGSSVSKYRYGLFYNNELVQLITFGRLRNVVGHNHIDGSYELIRLCSKLNIVVVGGASKLFKYFIKTHNPKQIISFANRDWSTGNVYNKLGMNLVGTTSPGYFYSNGHRREHRYSVQKHKLVKMGFDKNKTEYEIMSERGYYRIWNTGNFKYEIKF